MRSRPGPSSLREGARRGPHAGRPASGLRVHAAALASACLLTLAACSESSGPDGDRTAPAAPRLDRISVGIPQGGMATVTGADSTVEPRVTVVVENLTAGVREGAAVSASTNASLAGAFVVQIPALIGDQLSVFAVDAADNRGPAVHLAAGPNPASFRLLVVSGSGQTGVVGRPLTEPLRVRVIGGSPAVDLPGIRVRFDVTAGGGSANPGEATSDAEGIATTELTLGSSEGAAEVRASVDGVEGELLFDATGVGTPQIVTVSPTEGNRGSSVEIVGRNFSPIPGHDLVEFNGVEAEVLEAAPERLTVTVPTFASDGAVTVTLTGVRSNGVPFKVNGPPPVLPAVGSVSRTAFAISGGQLALDLRLGFLSGSETYVVAVQALRDDPAFVNHGIAADLAALEGMGPAPAAGKARPRGTGRLAAAAGQARAERALREWEAQVAAAARGKGGPPAARIAGGEPQVGDEETFHVINTIEPTAIITDPANFDEVEAVLRYRGASTLVYVDERVSSLDLTDADVRDVGTRFDTQTYAIDRDAFGGESDIDGDGRVTILLTPTVNALNVGADPAAGIVIGFFFSLDLVPSFSPNTSNGREMFYGFVPDPSGRFGPPIPREFAIPTLDELFAHEFQHMISFNEHVFVRGGQPELTWLNEGLSHLAEELNGFPEGNVARTALYLTDPGVTGLALSRGDDTLEARGAAFLFLRWLGDQLGEDIYRSLVQTSLVGIGNVESHSAEPFEGLFSDWIAGLYLDDSGLGAATHQIPSLTLRTTYEGFRSGNPELGLGPFLGLLGLTVPSGGTTSGSTVGTAARFYEVDTTGGPNERKLTISAPLTSQAQVTVIRTR